MKTPVPCFAYTNASCPLAMDAKIAKDKIPSLEKLSFTLAG